METMSYRYFYNESRKIAINEILLFFNNNVESVDLSEMGSKLPVLSDKSIIDSIEYVNNDGKYVLKFSEYNNVYGNTVRYDYELKTEDLFTIADFVNQYKNEIEQIIKDQNPEDAPLKKRYKVNIYYTGEYNTIVDAVNEHDAKQIALKKLEAMTDGELLDALELEKSGCEVIEDI